MEGRGIKAALDEITRREIKNNQDLSFKHNSLCKNCLQDMNLQTGEVAQDLENGNQNRITEEGKIADLEIHSGREDKLESLLLH